MPNTTLDPSKVVYRAATLEQASVDEKKRTIQLAFSSEEPVPRDGYLEVLDHGENAVDLSRLNDGGAVLV